MGLGAVLAIGWGHAVTLVHAGRHPPSQRPPTLRPSSQRASTQRPARDLGRWVARALCALFALVGLIPPLLGSLTRWQPVQDWAASETARILSQQLGLSATYKVNV